MDLIRKVLGDKKLYYFGISYGTELGGVYAHMFPKSVGRAVFDGVVDPTANSEQGSLGQAKGFQLALGNFAKDCVDARRRLPVQGSTAQEVEAESPCCSERARQRPVPGTGGRKLTADPRPTASPRPCTRRSSGRCSNRALDEAEGGNGRCCSRCPTRSTAGTSRGRYSNLQAANTAINCADSKERYTAGADQGEAAGVPRGLAGLRRLPRLGHDGLHDWPVPDAGPTPDVSPRRDPPRSW